MTHAAFAPRHLILALPTLALALNLAVGAADATEVGQSGQLSGRSDHVTTGTVTIERDGDAIYVVLGDDFSLDGAPSPTLGFAVDGQFVAASEFAELGSLTGGQRYEVPASLSLSEFDAFVVWCSEFAIPLGAADLG